MAPLRALEIMESVLNALAAAHDAGLVHRDVKPENVLIADRGQIKVADFGLAKAVSAQTSTATAGLLIGTVSYLPPELVVSGHADARSDVYSAGVVLFELLTGRKPHIGDTPIQVAYAHVHADVPPPSSLPTAGPIPDYLDALLATVTARDPQARPHDARVMLTQLRRVEAALRDGVRTDTELTQDLTVPLRALAGAGEPTPVVPTGPDAEPTTFVTSTPLPTDQFPTDQFPTDQFRTDQFRTDRFRPDPRPAAPRSPSSPAATTWGPPTYVETTDDRPQDRLTARPTDRTASPAAALSHRRTEEQRVRQRTRRIRGLIVLIVVLLLTAMATLGGWYLAAGRFTSAPSLTGLDQEQAARTASAAGVSVRFEPTWSETAAPGTVITTDPGPGAKMLADGQVAAIVSKGPERYAAPTLVGLTQAQATAALTAQNLALGRVTAAWNETVVAGTVTAASTPPGTRLRRESRVDLTVSKGKKPIPIASWVGKDAAAATKALTKAGFELKVTTANSATVAKGDVISQTPTSGSGHRGDTVSLERSLGPVMVTVPTVKRMGIRAATSTLQAAGFTVATRHASLYLGLGYVASSDPAGGTKAPAGSTITLSLV
jgi:serine/threonine-protein kinase